jgi:hypothetical protein
VSQDLVLTNARIVLDDAIIAGTVHVREGLITGIYPARRMCPAPSILKATICCRASWTFTPIIWKRMCFHGPMCAGT